MNNKNINLFSTFFPLNSINSNNNKNTLTKNNSYNSISKETVGKININKSKKDDPLSFAFFNSGKFKNINNQDNSLLNNKKKNKIPLIKNNKNYFEFNYNINQNLTKDNINNNNKVVLNLSKNIFDPNFLDKNNIIYNKNRNYFSKESIY